MDAAWADVLVSIGRAPYPVEVLPVDPERGQACLASLEVSPRSWLGAVVLNCGGLVIDRGWLRVLGGGHTGLVAVSVGADASAGVVVGCDVLGGQFAWRQVEPGRRPTVQYFAPDDLAWQDLELGYSDWLHAMLTGAVTSFYESLRWPGWQPEVASTALDQGIHTVPPLWTTEGKDLSAVSRRAVGMKELVALHHEMARQIGPSSAR